MTARSLTAPGEPYVGLARLARRFCDTLISGAGLLAVILTLWLRLFRAGGVSALAKAVVWTLFWPLWLVYLIAFVGVRL